MLLLLAERCQDRVHMQANAAALADSVQRMAQMALLGLGNAAKLFPDWQDLDELYAANAEEQPSRVML